VLLDGADPLLQAFDAFLNLAVGELDERAGFSELFLKIGSIIGMAPIEMHLKSFGNKLELMPESFCEDTSVTLAIGNFSPKGFGSSTDNLLNLH
jgi:hypothetical protein